MKIWEIVIPNSCVASLPGGGNLPADVDFYLSGAGFAADFSGGWVQLLGKRLVWVLSIERSLYAEGIKPVKIFPESQNPQMLPDDFPGIPLPLG